MASPTQTRQWFNEVFRGGQSLRRQAVLWVASATLVTGLLFAAFSYVRERDFLLDTLEQLAIARLDDGLLRSPETAERFWLRLVGQSGSLLRPLYLVSGETRKGDLEARLEGENAYRPLRRKDLVDPGAAQRDDVRAARRTRLFGNRVEIHLRAATPAGPVYLAFYVPGLDLHLLGNMARNALGLLVTALLAGVLLYLFLSVWIVRRVRLLKERFAQVERGETPPPLPVRGDDELARLFQGFNHMVDELAATNRLRIALADEQAGRQQDQEDFALRRQRETEQRYAALGRLSAGIAHEVNNPLTFIRGAVDPLHRQLVPLLVTADENQKVAVEALLDAIREGVERATQIIADMRLLSGGGGKIQPLDLRASLEQALRLMGPGLGERSLELLCEETLPQVAGSPGLLLQVWSNLLSNAIEATKPGEKIRVLAAADADKLDVVVEDAGHGLPEDPDFDPFEPFATGRDSGTGLGLPLVKSIVEKLGGAVILERSDLGGVRVVVTLPVITGDRLAKSSDEGEAS